MRILGIRLRFTIAVALALAGYVAFLPQKIAPGKNEPVKPPQAPAPQAPLSPPTQTPPPAVTPSTPPQAGALPTDTSGAPTTTGTASSSEPSGSPSATDQAPDEPLPADPSALPRDSGASPSATGPIEPLTPAQRAAAKLPPAPDSALPTTEAPTEAHSGQPGSSRADVAAGTRGAGNTETARTPGAAVTPSGAGGVRSEAAAPAVNRSPAPILLGGPTVGLPLPPRPRFNRGQYIADTALSFRGLPYKWGGTSPSTGMDCSGFIVAVCKKWHLDVPHSVTEQYHLGRPIRLAEIQPGDLMFFKNTYKPGLSHVAIYVGDNQFVDAGDEKAGVMLRELGPHGMEHWVGARRLDLSSLPPAPGEPLLPPHR